MKVLIEESPWVPGVCCILLHSPLTRRKREGPHRGHSLGAGSVLHPLSPGRQESRVEMSSSQREEPGPLSGTWTSTNPHAVW